MEGCFKVPLVIWISLFTSWCASVDLSRDTYGICRSTGSSTEAHQQHEYLKKPDTVKTKCDPHICAVPVEANLKARLKKCKHKNTSINKVKDSPKQTTCKDLPECFSSCWWQAPFFLPVTMTRWSTLVCLKFRGHNSTSSCPRISRALQLTAVTAVCLLLTWCLPSNNRVSFHYLFSNSIGVLYRQAIFTVAAHLQYRKYTMCTFLTLHSAALLSSQGSHSVKRESDE